MNTTVASNLRNLRRKNGMTQEQVADHLHISQPAYARIESGESSSWATHLEAICELFEIEPEELFKQEQIIINHVKTNNGVNGTGHIGIVNLLSEKVIEQYEARLKEKDELIKLLRDNK